MQKIGHSTPTANAEGEFSEGNPSAGVEPTWLTAKWHNSVQRELIAIVSAAGIELDPVKDDQVLESMRSIIRQAVNVYALDVGIANAYNAAYTPAITTLTDGLVVRFKAKNANSGQSTFAPNAVPAKPIVGLALKELPGAEVAANGICTVIWSTALDKWVLLSCTGGVPQLLGGTKSQQAVSAAQLFGGLKGLQVFTSGGSFVVPDGVSTIFMSGAGGGGGGGGSGGVNNVSSGFSSSGGGGGGASGAFAIRQSIMVTPGQTLIISIGSGGLGGAAGTAGGNGGSGFAGGPSTITGTGVNITLAGGLGGGGGSGVTGVNNGAGAGGSAGGPSAQSGQWGLGVAGYGFNIGGPGGSGGSGPFGAAGGGRSTTLASAGQAASGNGAGGAGACGVVIGVSGSGTGASGGVGSAGVFFLEW